LRAVDLPGGPQTTASFLAEALEGRTLLSYAYMSFAAAGSTAPTGDGALTLGSDAQATVRIYVYGVSIDPSVPNPTPTGTVGLYWYTPGARSFGSDADYNGNATLAPLAQGLAYADLTITTLDASGFPKDAAGDLQLIGFYSGDENFRQDQSYPVTPPVDDPYVGNPVPDNQAFIGVTIVDTTNSLVITTPPGDTAPGAAMSPITVENVNASGVVDSADSDSISVAITSSSAGTGTLSGTTTVSTLAGVATFSGLSIDKAGQYGLTFTDSKGDTVKSGTFDVIDSKLVFLTQPSNEAVNGAVPVTVELVGPTGNLIADRDATVVLSLNTVSGGTGATLSGTTSLPLVGGVATFTAAAGPAVNVTGAYTFTATAEDASTGTLAPIAATAPGKSAKFQVGAAVTVESVTTDDSKSLSVTYQVAANPTGASFPITVYRSPDATYVPDDAGAVAVATLMLSPADAVEGTHSITVSPYGTANVAYAFSQPAPFRPDPTHKYVVATADQTGVLSPDDAVTVAQSGFRIWLIGAVTHGYVGSIPAVLNSEVPTDFSGEYQSFVDQFAAGLTADGYDASIAFHWEYEADKAVPMQPNQQGVILEQLVLAKEIHLGTALNDVVDLNLIGWSRGTIVVNTALTVLNGDPLEPADMKRGFIGETLVDPHPANNGISQASVYPGNNPAVVGEAYPVVHGYLAFQTAVHDLQGVGFVIPPNVDAVSDMYQHNPASTSYGSESLLNLWGLSPAQMTPNGVTPIIDHQVTTAGIGHSGIMLDTERHLIQGDQTLQALNLYPFGSTANPAALLATLDAPADVPAVADHLAVTAPSTAVLANGTFSLTVSATDAFGAVDATYNGPITIALNGTGAGTLSGTLTATATGGVATFAGLTLTDAGTYRVTASADGAVSAASPWFAVTNDQLVVTAQPANPTLAQPFGLIVSAVRADGSVDTSFTGVVSLAAAAEPTDVPQPLGGVFARAAVGGSATFYGLTLPTAGDYLITASSAGTAAGSTDGFTVSGAPATHLVVTTPLATPVTTGAPFTLGVAAEDGAGHLDATFDGPVTLTVTAGPGTLGGTTTVTAVDGFASFTGLALSTAGAGYTLTAAGDGFTATVGATASAAGVATTLSVAVPTGATAGEPFAVTVSATDGFGTVDATFTGSVTLSAAQLGATGVALGGTLTVNAVAGVATFGDLTISTAGVGYTFAATATGLAGSTPSAPLTVAAGTATQLTLVAPLTTVPGAPFTLLVRAEDAYGNLATGFAGTVTLSSAGQALGGTLTATAVGGVAAFDTLVVPAAGPAGAITATAGALTGSTAALSAAPDQLVVTTAAPEAVAVGAPIGLAVSALTAAGAVDAAFDGTVTVALLDPAGTGATLAGTLTATAANGVATFAGLGINVAGIYALVVTADPTAAAGTTTGTLAVTAVSPAASSTVVPTFGKVKLPASAIAGQAIAGSLPLTLTAGATAVSGKFTVRLYADRSATLAGGQVLLGTFPQSGVLRAGKGRAVTLRLKSLPASLPAGTYHLLAEVVDPAGGTALVATSQTVAVAAPVVTLTATVTGVSPRTVKAGKTFTTTVALANAGNVSATGRLVVTVALSSDGTAAGIVTTLPALTRTVKIAAGKSLRLSVKGKLPAGATSFYPVVTAALSPAASVTVAGPLVTVS
jgi:hypothetical protein